MGIMGYNVRNQQKTANPWYLCGNIICKSFFQAGPLNAGCKLAVALFFGCFNGDWRRIWWRCKCHDISTATRARGFGIVWIRRNNWAVWATLVRLMHFMDFWTILITCIHFGQCTFILAAACRTMMFVISTRSRCFPWLRFHRTPLGKENVKLDIEVSCLKHTRGPESCYSWYGDLWSEVADQLFGCHYTILYMFLYLYCSVIRFWHPPNVFGHDFEICRWYHLSRFSAMDLTLGVEGCWSERLSISQNLQHPWANLHNFNNCI